MDCYVFDIDGVIADCRHRLHYIQKQPKDWEGFFGTVGHDKPIESTITLLSDLYMVRPVIFITGRPERTREATKRWLREWVSPDVGATAPVYMRADGDRRPDTVVKLELLNRALLVDKWHPIMIFEDRTRVVQAYRNDAWSCAQITYGVGDGDF